MKLKDLKYRLLDQRAQIIVFHKSGELLDSCHSLVNLEASIGRSVYDKWPVLEGVRATMETLGTLEPYYRLPAVEFALPDLNGIFDFEFYPHPEEPQQVLWLMLDQSRIYRYFQRIQQERNVLLLEKEYRDTGRHFHLSSPID
jgi:hypothetical protein